MKAILATKATKALFTRRQCNPSGRVTLALGSKIARVYKQNDTVWVSLLPGVNSIFGNCIITNKMEDRRKILAAMLILLSDKAGR